MCDLCTSVPVGRDRRPQPVTANEATERLSRARQRVDGIDLHQFAGLHRARTEPPERLGGTDDVRGGVVAQAYAAMGRTSHGVVPVQMARAIESGAGFVARGVAGLYVPPWVGGGGRIVWNVPLVAGLMGREAPEDRDALATLIVAHERTHHLQHGHDEWQIDYLALLDDVVVAGRRPDRSLMERTVATMSVVEGHASLVERDVVEHLHGDDVWWRVRGRHLDRRIGGLLAGLMSALVASKRDQYKRGMLFCADAREAIPDAARVLFGRRGAMPFATELDAASSWSARVRDLP